MKSIPWSRIPRTFRDAIKVTRALGIAHVWIDSVCIIQDDKGDWEREAANMHSIYENSHITIGATSAPGPNGGLYLRKHNSIFQESGRTSLGAQFAVIGRKVCLHPNGRDNRFFFRDDRRPLMGRAWILQERLLSPRFLHFTSDEMIWECKGDISCECGESSVKDMSMKQAHHETLTSTTVEQAAQAWRLVVSSYCDLNLSFESDKLPALSGLAAKVAAARPGSQYLAGLWSDSIHHDLLWRVAPLYRRLSKNRRPLNWRAPTWSWASLDAPIDFPPTGTVTRLFQTIHGWTSPATGDQWGRVTNGSLTICGSIFPARMEMEDSRIIMTMENRIVVLSRNPARDTRNHIHLYLDILEDKPLMAELLTGSTISCLRVAHLDHEDYFESEHTLVLCCRRGSIKFERIGIISQEHVAHDGSMAEFWASEENPFAQGGEQKTIEII